MDLEMVFNELSAQSPAADITTARQWMSELISTMREAKRCGLKGIRTQEDFHAMVLAENYPLSRWRNDNEVNREERTFLRTLATKTPLSVDISDIKIQIKIENMDCEFSLQGSQAEGFKVAHYLETLAISLNSETLWDNSRIKLELTQIDEHENLIEESVEVIHASQTNHVLEHANWIKNRLQSERINGVELWNRRDELFPSLLFCDAGNKQLRKLRSGEERLQFVLEILYQLENYAKNWKTGYFSLEGVSIEVSGESEATLNKYGKERTFLCPDGEERLFDRHVKLKECNWRIHFFAEVSKQGKRKVIIGYIGLHLPTVKYPT
ncbi:MAG: hypothetical protein JGK21_21325 [Microcoleus sp. PH2017_22_RUC_O_B]|uniref:hypothetical protein n=1 Tax=unclassified Microcoleus TaxID=2642155 RepID=UPI001D4EC5AD|nr:MULTISPECIES: hypothetical protein [unclassified Microcoleus]MCC3530522.1 hypothetical protein [Microcoleus sp. PH2017_21_RUC_O_A]MCC3542844.1 hypothetical protein [Microcoleus sp. PH2017_22_RUC_O_B]